jgi:hypothetical protein
MIHVRIDTEVLNCNRRFACGIGPELPEGDVYYFQGEAGADRSDCPGCNPAGPRRLGTPISQLSTQPGKPGYEEWCRISQSWGYE